jgi:hypothetical protein
MPLIFLKSFAPNDVSDASDRNGEGSVKNFSWFGAVLALVPLKTAVAATQGAPGQSRH